LRGPIRGAWTSAFANAVTLRRPSSTTVDVHGSAARAQEPVARPPAAPADRVEHDVEGRQVALPALRPVVDGMVDAERADRVVLRARRRAPDLGPVAPGDLVAAIPTPPPAAWTSTRDRGRWLMPP